MRLLILVPARGGSKRFPGKNLASLAGIPLVGRAARLGRRCLAAMGGEGRVICSTDDAAIAAAAREWGAETPFLRPAELATDGAASIDVVRHALDALGEPYDVVVLLQPTSPLTEPADVLGAIALARATESPVISVCATEHPLEWACTMDDSGRLARVLDGESGSSRRGPTYRPNGAVYVASPGQVREGGFWTAETRGYVMPAGRSPDVDREADLALADAFLRAPAVQPIDVAGRSVGPGQPCFVIAEAGVNHNGDLGLARRLVDAAAKAGADAVKFQSFRAEKVVSKDTPLADYQRQNAGQGTSMLELVKRLELSPAHHRTLLDHCREQGITFLSTPFDEESADLLEELGVPAFKLPSGEVTNADLLRHVGRKGRPVILSTGMSTLVEVASAVDELETAGCRTVVLLQCVSNYPADPADVNLRAMRTLELAFARPAGYSDHTLGNEVAFAAVAMGACLVEKHFTLDRSLPGPDHKASAEPSELATLVRGIRCVEAAFGTGVKVPAPSEANTASVARRSLVAARDIAAGELLTADAIAFRRPGNGLPLSRRTSLVGRKARRDVAADSLLAEDMFE
ncbi:MAG: N-acetylneuraminate synthase [Thermoanaerobaculia bacterium]